MILIDDDTFKIRPKQFYQLFSVFIKNEKLYTPVVFNLTLDKTT